MATGGEASIVAAGHEVSVAAEEWRSIAATGKEDLAAPTVGGTRGYDGGRGHLGGGYNGEVSVVDMGEEA